MLKYCVNFGEARTTVNYHMSLLLQTNSFHRRNMQVGE